MYGCASHDLRGQRREVMACREDSPRRRSGPSCATATPAVLKGASEQVDPNDPNYDPDEDEPRQAPVSLHAGHGAEVAAFKQAVRPRHPHS